MARVTATEAARSFSDVLNRVATGEEFEITRGGAPVAVIGPPVVRLLGADRFRELLRHAPPVDDEFASDVRTIKKDIGPPEGAWPS
jgi:antitoxin (DNA-binding transcriptional repressor) of toxin-antitoxin stability system